MKNFLISTEKMKAKKIRLSTAEIKLIKKINDGWEKCTLEPPITIVPFPEDKKVTVHFQIDKKTLKEVKKIAIKKNCKPTRYIEELIYSWEKRTGGGQD